MLRVALFGTGRIGQVHARSITEHGKADLAWVCDPIEQAASTPAGKFGARSSPEPADAISGPSVDAVPTWRRSTRAGMTSPATRHS